MLAVRVHSPVVCDDHEGHSAAAEHRPLTPHAVCAFTRSDWPAVAMATMASSASRQLERADRIAMVGLRVGGRLGGGRRESGGGTAAAPAVAEQHSGWLSQPA